jgi:toxoflavin synthase
MNVTGEVPGQYVKTNLKADKKYSVLPTILHLLESLEEKVVVDVGCGDGFFSRAIVEKNPSWVYGIDFSREQIEKAKLQAHPKINYSIQDMFAELPRCDLINAPFVLNYAQSISELSALLKNFYCSLTSGGKLVTAVDLPKLFLDDEQIARKKKFGAVKKFESNLVDGSEIQIDLFGNQEHICTLWATYFSPQSLERCLRATGFEDIKWHSSIISEEGRRILGDDFWQDYSQLCELGYLTACKQVCI